MKTVFNDFLCNSSKKLNPGLPTEKRTIEVLHCRAGYKTNPKCFYRVCGQFSIISYMEKDLLVHRERLTQWPSCEPIWQRI